MRSVIKSRAARYPQVWVCLAGLKPKKKCKRFGEGRGAYVHIAAVAGSQVAFQQRVKRAVEELDCVLQDLDDVQLLEDRLNSPGYPEELLDMATTARSHPEDAVFGTFHIWLRSDAN
jgi:hypothetical protein